jgi:antitoxin ParD1/3/4
MKSSSTREQSPRLALRPQWRRFIAEKIDSGQFASETEVVEGALMQMQAEERLTARDITELRREIAVGLKDLEEGRSAVWNVAELKAHGRRLLASRRGKKK